MTVNSHHADCRAASSVHPDWWDDPSKCNCAEAAQREFDMWRREEEARQRHKDRLARLLSPENILVF